MGQKFEYCMQYETKSHFFKQVHAYVLNTKTKENKKNVSCEIKNDNKQCL